MATITTVILPSYAAFTGNPANDPAANLNYQYKNDKITNLPSNLFLPTAGVRSFSDMGIGITIGRTGMPVTWNAFPGYEPAGGSFQYHDVVTPSYKPSARSDFCDRRRFSDHDPMIVSIVGSSTFFVMLDERQNVWMTTSGVQNFLYMDPGDFNRLNAVFDGCAKQIAARDGIFHVLSDDGKVYTASLMEALKQPIVLPEKIRLIGSGPLATYAVGNSGNVYVWGENSNCNLGDSIPACNGWQNILTPQRLNLPGISGHNIRYIGGGASRIGEGGYTNILMENGDLYGWGTAAAIGKGTQSLTVGNSALPYRILSHVETVCNNRHLSVALSENRRDLYTWGIEHSPSVIPLGLHSSTPKLRSATHLKPDEYITKLDCFEDHFYYTTNFYRIFGVGMRRIMFVSGGIGSSRVETMPWPGKEMTNIMQNLLDVELLKQRHDAANSIKGKARPTM